MAPQWAPQTCSYSSSGTSRLTMSTGSRFDTEVKISGILISGLHIVILIM